MTHYDVFNGDADGICALHQLRLASPLDSTLVTGAAGINDLPVERLPEFTRAFDAAFPALAAVR